MCPSPSNQGPNAGRSVLSVKRPGFLRGIDSTGPQISVAGITDGAALAGVVGAVLGTTLGLGAAEAAEVAAVVGTVVAALDGPEVAAAEGRLVAAEDGRVVPAGAAQATASSTTGMSKPNLRTFKMTSLLFVARRIAPAVRWLLLTRCE